MAGRQGQHHHRDRGRAWFIVRTAPDCFRRLATIWTGPGAGVVMSTRYGRPLCCWALGAGAGLLATSIKSRLPPVEPAQRLFVPMAGIMQLCRRRPSGRSTVIIPEGGYKDQMRTAGVWRAVRVCRNGHALISPDGKPPVGVHKVETGRSKAFEIQGNPESPASIGIQFAEFQPHHFECTGTGATTGIDVSGVSAPSYRRAKSSHIWGAGSRWQPANLNS